MILPPLPEPLERPENQDMIVRAICAGSFGRCRCAERVEDLSRDECAISKECAGRVFETMREILARG